MLCVLPIGDFAAGAPDLKLLQSYCSAFFGMETRLLSAVPLAQVPAKKRINEQSKKRQLLSTDILNWMWGRRPRDAYAVIAVTMEDLYPQESWNFVFGQAALKGGAGVFSFARYAPSFYGDRAEGDVEKLILERSLKVLTHEMTHMFGIRHCVFFECLMNGSNHLAETDSRPMHLCPVCLRKLHMARPFDLLRREEQLEAFYKAAGMTGQAVWTGRRIDKLRSAK
jgi:archaemetzincin